MIKVPNQNITHHSKAINTKLDSDPLNLEVRNFGELKPQQFLSEAFFYST